ncbi:GP46-like surface antigen, putative [Bodo saltans]|uniref:GP46-like surface antigen, putative n=1 Tax=Bodo saltans TaxID=75058 RepID=A0A0S4IV27_BODSA|nr:GP46-like surface antigen, putative [Bodo saltans]|eukprot:CUF97400.1 GP46-like surface antigen, putative [Bodo saltans]
MGTQFWLLLIVATLVASVANALDISQVESLQQFYTATGGASWLRNDGWTTPFALWKNPCNATVPTPRLYGVTCGAGEVQVLILSTNNLVGTIPATFFLNFPTLSTVQLQSNPLLTGAIPDFPQGSTLSNLLLQQCSFSGTIPSSVFTPTLIQLQVEINQLTGGVPSNVGTSTQLSILEIGQNKLNIGAFPASLVNCTALTLLSVMNSGVTQLPADLDRLQVLSTLNLQGNDLTGSIPEAWCNIRSLTSLFLQDNNGLSGSLPDCIGNWTQLIHLVIENTRMTGSIPTVVFTAFPELQQLALSGSMFSGTIPDLFANIPKLQHAEFNGNNQNWNQVYSGAFPESLLELENLQTLSIQYTNLLGPTKAYPFSRLTQIQSLTLATNPKMVMVFPTEILTDLWSTPSYVEGTQRALLISNLPLTGTLPNIPEQIANMSTVGGLSFAQTDITGYIPNSTFLWVPEDSRKGLLAHCTKLLAPIAPWMLPLTNNFQGMQFSLSGAYNGVSTFSMTGGDELGIVGQNFVNIPNRLFCGFCVSGNTDLCTGDIQSLPPQQLNTNLVFTSANQSLPGVMFCQTPAVPYNYSIQVYLFYVGPAYGDDTEHYRVSSGGVTIQYYNPTPLLYDIVPNHGRIEGCSTIYAVGSGFLNAPNMTLRIAGSIWAAHGVVMNDSFVQFVIPSANASSINTQYPFPINTSLEVDLFPAGGNTPGQIANSNATYAFEVTCNTPLVLCAHGFQDPELCPVAPLCRCFSEGTCAWGNTSWFTSSSSFGSPEASNFAFQCQCVGGFTGAACEQCKPGYYGPSCSKCTCVHGACLDGMSRDGSCDCDSAYLGGTCTISKLGLGVGIPAGLVVAGLVAFCIKRRFRRHGDEYGAVGMNTEIREKSTGGYGGAGGKLLP